MNNKITPLFSIIVPCYNVSGLVADCLDTLTGQSIGIENLEIILVDDASTDNTLEVLKEYENRFPDRIILIPLDRNGRQGTARNAGLRYAAGEYISFVDADDLVRKDMYEILYEVIQNVHPDIVQFRYKVFVNVEDIVEEKVDIKSISENEKILKIYDFNSGKRSYLLDSGVYNESCTQKVYKKELLQKSGVSFAEGVAYEEPKFTYPLKFFVGRVAVLDMILYHYRNNEGGTTLNYMADPKTIFDHLMTQLETKIFVDGCAEADDYKDEKELYFIHSFYCEPFYFFKKRGWVMPVSLWRFMASKLTALVPDHSDNKYLKDPSMTEELSLLRLIDHDNESDKDLQQMINEVMEKLE